MVVCGSLRELVCSWHMSAARVLLAGVQLSVCVFCFCFCFCCGMRHVEMILFHFCLQCVQPNTAAQASRAQARGGCNESVDCTASDEETEVKQSVSLKNSEKREKTRRRRRSAQCRRAVRGGASEDDLEEELKVGAAGAAATCTLYIIKVCSQTVV